MQGTQRSERMKNALRLLIVLGLVWMAGLELQQSLGPHFLLDRILPQRLLMLSTAEEREQMVKGLRTTHAPSGLSWIGACSVFLLSSYALWMANRNDRKRSLKQPPEPSLNGTSGTKP
jgi:hypothetical protein